MGRWNDGQRKTYVPLVTDDVAWAALEFKDRMRPENKFEVYSLHFLYEGARQAQYPGFSYFLISYDAWQLCCAYLEVN